MSVAEKKPNASRSLPQALAEVRRKIRAYVAIEGLGSTVATAALSFWAALGIDWLFEPSRPVRIGLLIAAAVATIYVFARRFLSRVFAKLGDRNLAMVVERRYSHLNESLLTAIELDPASLNEHGQAMLADTRRQAEDRLASIGMSKLFDMRPRNQAVAAALLTAGSLAAFALGTPELFDLGVRRLTAQTDEAWPRRTHLSIEGFANGEKVIPQGADVELLVRADATKEIPSEVSLRYRTDDGVRDEQIMDREGVAQPGVDPYQQYKFIFRGMSSSMSFDVVGGDARIRNLRIRVVERPQIRLRLSCKYPEYTGRSDGEIDVTGTVPLPQGTIVAATASANKPLRSVTITKPDGAGGTVEEKLDLMTGGKPQSQFRFEIGRLSADAVVSFRLQDDDGIENVAALALQAVVDAPPAVAVTRRGLENVVTPQAQVPFAGKVTDDYGVGRLWFDYAIEGTEPRQRSLTNQPQKAREVAVAESLELREAFSDAPLQPGQSITVSVRGEDNRNLPDLTAGNVAAGDVSTLTVVTDAELLRLLEAREIMFREQFKALIAKVTRSRDGLVDVGSAAPKPVEADEPDAVPLNRDIVLLDQTRAREKEQRAETLSVSDGFAAIVAELINNRAADSERLQERLAAEISEPLRRIGDVSFADYEAKLARLHAAVSKATVDPDEVANLRRETLQSVDKILVEMNLVLEKMQELESFKEAIDLLKSIIAMQKEIGERTKKSRVDKGRLLD